MANQGKGLSLHIGVKHVDSSKYHDRDGKPWKGLLAPCELDAKDMAALAEAQGFRPTTLLTAQAKADTILARIGEAADQLHAGDVFFLTFSGHGGRVKDGNGDEPEGMDETWVAYDRQLADDELYDALTRFKAGVRVFIATDSCHSGTVARRPPDKLIGAKALPKAVESSEKNDRAQLYEDIQRTVPSTRASIQRLAADVLLLSACKDEELAYVGPKHSVFTGVFLKTWGKGTFQGTYRDFYEAIAAGTRPTQNPQWFPPSGEDPAFADERPLTI